MRISTPAQRAGGAPDGRMSLLWMPKGSGPHGSGIGADGKTVRFTCKGTRTVGRITHDGRGRDTRQSALSARSAQGRAGAAGTRGGR